MTRETAPVIERRDALLVCAVVFGLAAGLVLVLGVPARAREGPGVAQVDPSRGRQLFERSCSSCHGTDGRGVTTSNGELRGPSLENAGAAAAYYQLATGRMPLANSGEVPRRKPAVFDRAEIAALVDYVASLGKGPPLPTIDVSGADLAKGGELFRANCAACHSASGAGGALSYGRAAPSLGAASPEEIAAAVRSGPTQMPVFGPDVLPDQELADVAAYVRYLQNPQDPGGLPIGRIGPVPEGFVAWFFGATALLAIVAWIGTRAPARPSAASEQDG